VEVWQRRWAMRAKRCTRLGVVVALFSLATACSDDQTSGALKETSPPTPAPSTSPDESSSAPGSSEKGVPVALYTHCGVVSLTLKGRLWLADPPLRDSSQTHHRNGMRTKPWGSCEGPAQAGQSFAATAASVRTSDAHQSVPRTQTLAVSREAARLPMNGHAR
jgi:hypothetical protein